MITVKDAEQCATVYIDYTHTYLLYPRKLFRKNIAYAGNDIVLSRVRFARFASHTFFKGQIFF